MRHWWQGGKARHEPAPASVHRLAWVLATEAGAQRTLEAVGFRVEPMVTQPAPPQTRTCAINAYGSSVTRVSAPLWRITLLPCTASQMRWTILGVGKAYVCSSCWHFSQHI